MNSKEWWKSKTVWAGLVGLLVVVYNAIPGYFPALHLPTIPEWVLGLLASLGVYGRVSATTTVK